MPLIKYGHQHFAENSSRSKRKWTKVKLEFKEIKLSCWEIQTNKVKFVTFI